MKKVSFNAHIVHEVKNHIQNFVLFTFLTLLIPLERVPLQTAVKKGVIHILHNVARVMGGLQKRYYYKL